LYENRAPWLVRYYEPVSMDYKYFLQALADFLYPPQCLLCRSFLLSYNNRYFCEGCFQQFAFIGGPVCPQCGRPFESGLGGDHLCGSCLLKQPFFDRARAIVVYESGVRTAVHLFKYKGKTALAAPLAEMLAGYGDRQLKKQVYTSIVPVPLHFRRLRQRGYNQSLLLARRLGKAWRIRVTPGLLQRHRRTAPQARLPAAERRMNVYGAFSCCRSQLDGERILLVDDVYTSGATVNECARILKRHGASAVDVLTLARTK